MTRWLSIVGIGEDGLDGITPAARVLVDQAEVLVGGARHLAMIADDHPAERLPWVPPMAAGTKAVVANHLNVSKPAIVRALDSLGKLEFVRRGRDESDRRSVLIHRTVKGAVFLSEFAGLIAAAAKPE